MVYNKHHPTNQMDTAHSSLDKKCPSLIAVLANYKKNSDYQTDDTQHQNKKKYDNTVQVTNNVQRS